ncbi:hypothetical protein TNCV_1131061 [Trichonephila clavipes]|nr:hypothetical protein TNCV_1131061 [Trichonephila clavipes]
MRSSLNNAQFVYFLVVECELDPGISEMGSLLRAPFSSNRSQGGKQYQISVTMPAPTPTKQPRHLKKMFLKSVEAPTIKSGFGCLKSSSLFIHLRELRFHSNNEVKEAMQNFHVNQS